MSHGFTLLLMTGLFLGFGYMGVPVVFALMAGVLAGCMLTPISMQSMIGQMFHGIDTEILLACLLIDYLRKCHQSHGHACANHCRPFARRLGASRHSVQHVFFGHFGI